MHYIVYDLHWWIVVTVSNSQSETSVRFVQHAKSSHNLNVLKVVMVPTISPRKISSEVKVLWN